MDKKRFGIQAAAALIQNANLKGFFTGKLYTGQIKQVCVPGINCYSCPGAVGACPVGALQSFLDSRPIRFPYYVVGLLLFFGAVLGRAVCGFLCPFGFLQELISFIPFPKRRNHFRFDRQLRKIKYGILALTLALPLLIPRIPFFCKYLCPSGTIAGILLSIHDSMVASSLGALFSWKFFVLLCTVVSCLIIFRPFCKYLCPLGAAYGMCNRFSLYTLQVDSSKCVGCHRCSAVCKMCVDPITEPNSPECIRCGACSKACPSDAIRVFFRKRQ